MGMHSVDDYEVKAKEVLNKYVWDYYNFSKERGLCFQDSVNAFSRYRIRSRSLQGVSNRSLATTVLGQPLKHPICISPTSNHVFAHPDGEKATAKGAGAAEALMVLSAGSCTPMADVVAEAPGSLRWMQIYPFVDRELTLNVIREAESLGFKAIVITVDYTVEGSDGRMDEIFSQDRIKNHPVYRKVNLEANNPSLIAALAAGDTKYFYCTGKLRQNPGATWDEVRWIKSITSLPIVCKGILSAESAKEAVDAGSDGILVSAHGGRHFDGAPAPIDALAEVVNAVRGCGVEVYMDGGVRTGTDVFKALGRGAKAVFVGRPILWGLACEGADGVRNVLQIIRKQLDAVLAMSGEKLFAPQDVHQPATFHPIQLSMNRTIIIADATTTSH